MMISNNYPLLYQRGDNWLYVGGIIIVGGLVRLFINAKDGGISAWYVDWALPGAVVLAVAMVMSTIDFGPKIDANLPPVHFAQVQPIFQQRCLSCHSATPTDSVYKAPPKGVMFDTPDEIKRLAPQIYRMAVLTRTMPQGNKTGMTQEERDLIGRWIAGGAGD